MNLILDAHIVIWSVIPNLMLSQTICDLINAQKEPVGFSIAQFWEVEITSWPPDGCKVLMIFPRSSKT